MKKAILVILMYLLIPLVLFAQISVMGELTRYHEASSGNEYEGTVRLRNTGTETSQVKVYLRDYSFQADGSSYYLDPGTLERSNAEWITLSASNVVLGEGEYSEIGYVINVPASQALSGTYWSILMVEGVPEEQELEGDDVPLITIRQVMRYGIQIVTDFPDSEESLLQFAGAVIRKSEEDGQRLFSIDITNSGNRWLNGEIRLELYHLSGVHAGSVSAGTFRTYPETSVRRSFPVDSIDPGTYKALLIADCGGDDLFGGNYTLQIQE